MGLHTKVLILEGKFTFLTLTELKNQRKYVFKVQLIVLAYSYPITELEIGLNGRKAIRLTMDHGGEGLLVETS